MQLGQTPKQMELLDEGTYPAIVAAIQDLGMVPKPAEFGGGESPKIRVYFLFNEVTSEGSPFYIRKDYTNSMAKRSSLRALIKAINKQDPGDKPVDDSLLLNKQCTVRVEHQEGSDGRFWMRPADVSAPLKNAEKVTIPSTWAAPKPQVDFSKQSNQTSNTQRGRGASAAPVQQEQVNDEDVAF